MPMNPRLLRPRATGGGGFSPVAVLLTSGTTYSVPAGATSMKAWAVGSGNVGAVANFGAEYGGRGGPAGGCAYKTWAVTEGSSVSYTRSSNGDSTVTYGGTTITGGAAPATIQGFTQVGGSFSGGDGGASGGWAGYGRAGAVGGNNVEPVQAGVICDRYMAIDISGLFAALTLAGVATVDTIGTCAPETAPFGAGGFEEKYTPTSVAGLGGGGIVADTHVDGTPGGAGAVVLYFT